MHLLTIYHSQQNTSPADLNSLTILTKGIPTVFRSATRLIELSAVRVTDVNKILPRHRERLPFQTYIFITYLVFFCRYFVNHSQPTTQCTTSQTSKYQYHFCSSYKSQRLCCCCFVVVVFVVVVVAAAAAAAAFVIVILVRAAAVIVLLLVLQALASGVMKSKHEADHPANFRVEAKNEWSHASV